MIKQPLVKQRSRAPPVTAAVTGGGHGAKRGSRGGRRPPVRPSTSSSPSEPPCLSASSGGFEHAGPTIRDPTPGLFEAAECQKRLLTFRN